jgi:hypothetical protein
MSPSSPKNSKAIVKCTSSNNLFSASQGDAVKFLKKSHELQDHPKNRLNVI